MKNVKRSVVEALYLEILISLVEMEPVSMSSIGIENSLRSY